MRKRKGDYFPDKEIDSRKPARKKYDGPSEEKRSARPSGDSKPYRDRPSKDRDERPARPARSSSDSKPYRDRPSKDRDERPARPARSSGDSKPFRDRPLRDRDERPNRSSEDKPFRDRPAESRDAGDKSARTYSPSNDRQTGRGRPAANRPSRPTSRTTEDSDSGTHEKRPYGDKKPFEKKREKYAKRDHSKEMRGRFNRDDRGKDKPYRKRPERSDRPAKKSLPKGEASSAFPTGEAVRLNRFIANAGICSRREADDLITAGVISINGKVVTELGIKVVPGDLVKYHEQPLKTEKLVYVLLNKPKDFITTADDPEERKTVMGLVKDACKERIYPVGRLDRNTTGLLLLTNDGDLTKKLTHPSSNIKKVYQVELDKNLTQSDMLKAADGVDLEDGHSGFDAIEYASPSDKNIIGVELHSGKNRIVRRIFEELGYEVKKLDRTVFAGLTKKDLPRGRWRFLTELEVSGLKMLKK